MEITVRLLASYRRLLPQDGDAQGGYCHRAAPGARVADVLAALPIPPGDPCTCLVNGRHADRHQLLAEGDVLSVFPAAGGG
jgi:molybdopterin converting factor small subunit